LRDAGFNPRFVSSEQIETGAFANARYVALMMPSSYAMSAKEAAVLRAKGCAVIPSRAAGEFDEHGRLRERPLFEASEATTWAERIRGLPRVVPREVTVTAADGEAHTAVRRFRSGNAVLLAFERNVHYHMSEGLRQAGGNEA